MTTPGKARPAVPRDKKPKEGRISRHLRVAGEVRENPRRMLPLLRGALLDVWRSRGGGFYGLGYIVAFIYFEIEMLVGDVVESASMSEFAFGQILEFLFRFGFMSFVNAFRALLWPVYVLQLYEGVGIIVLIGGYAAFEYALKPGVERLFPELEEHREHVRAKKAAARSKAAERKGAGRKAP